MKTFKTFIIEEAMNYAKKYICVEYSDETQDELRMYCFENGFDLSKSYSGLDKTPTDFKFHTTIFYSTTYHFLKNDIYEIPPFQVWPMEFEMLGQEKNIPVLRVEGPGLLYYRQHYEETVGLQDEWPSYKAHITLSYNKEQLPDLAKLKLPDFPLLIDKLKIADIEDV